MVLTGHSPRHCRLSLGGRHKGGQGSAAHATKDHGQQAKERSECPQRERGYDRSQMSKYSVNSE